MTPPGAGDLRHKVVFTRPTETADGKGGFVTSWPEIATAWAEVKGMDGRESVMEHVLQGVSVYRIRIRWRADLTIKPSDQARYAGSELNILSAVDPDGKRQQILIMAETKSVRATT